MRIKEYRVAFGQGIESTGSAISRLIEEGWQPYGSFVRKVGQPMVKYDLDASTPERRKALVRVDKPGHGMQLPLKGWVVGFSYETDMEPQGICHGASVIFEDLDGQPSTHWLMDTQYYEWERD